MEKKCYYTISTDDYSVTMTLDGCMEWIKGDGDNYNHEIVSEEDYPVYEIKPVWMTEEEFDNLPEADI